MDGAHPRTIYAVLYLLFTGTSFRISHVTGVPYQSVCLPILSVNHSSATSF